MATAALAVTAMAAPAQAQRWGGGHHRYHDHDHVSLGDALLGVLLVGSVVAATSDRHERERVVYDQPPPPEPNTDYRDAGPPPPQQQQGEGFNGKYDEESAADTCAQATQFTGQRYAKIAQIMGIDDVSGSGREWLVRGHVDLTDSWRSPRKGYDFRCTLSGGKEPEVTIEGLAAQ
jgi:hypothetical protein